MKNLKWLIAMAFAGLVALSTLGERVSTYCFYGDDRNDDVYHIDPRSTENLGKNGSKTFTATAPTGMTFSYWGIGPSQGNIAWDSDKTDTTYKYVSPSAQSTTVYLCARFDYIDYTITIDNNGGGGGSLTENTYDIRGATITVTAPTRSGYTLSGWTVSGATGGSPSISGNTLTIPANTYGNLTLRANWSEVTYTIYYKPGSFTKTEQKQEYQVPKAHGVDVTLYGKTYERDDGRAQDGWSLEPGGSSFDYGLKAVYTNNEDITLYPHWQGNTYQITALASPATGGSVSGGGEYMENREIELSATPSAGYHFVEWADGRTDNPLRIIVTGSITNTAFFAGNDYTVTYRAVGGQPKTTEKTVTFGECYGEQPTVTQKGYAFDGWYTEVDGEGDKIEPTSVVTNASNHNLYANWKPVYYVAFDGMGATSGTMPTQEVGCTMSMPLSVNMFEKAGHEFLGWATTREEADRCEPESVDYEDCVSVTDLAEQGATVTLYAVWKILPAYALDCPDLAVGAVDWTVCKTNDAINGSCLRLTDVSKTNKVSLTVPGTGILSFCWRGGADGNLEQTYLAVNAAGTQVQGLRAEKDMGWSTNEVDVVLPSSSDQGEVTFSCSEGHFYKFCMLDNVSFTPAGTLTLTRGTGIKAIYYRRSETEEWCVTTNAEKKVLVALDAKWSAYAEPEDGYVYTETSEQRPASGKMTKVGDSFAPVAELKTYTVTFHDEWLNTNEVRTVAYGETATPPNWSREGYNLSWDADFSCVTSDMLVNAIWAKEMGPYSDALDCTNLVFSGNEYVVISNCPNCKMGTNCLYMTSENGIVSTEVFGPGTLTFFWKGGVGQDGEGFKITTTLEVKLDDKLLEDVHASDGMPWEKIEVEVSGAGDLKFKIPSDADAFADFCALDYVRWAPKGGREPGPEDAATVSAAKVAGGKFVLEFKGKADFDYQVMTNGELTAKDGWAPMETLQGTGDPQNFAPKIDPAQPQLFYRIDTIQRQ